MWPIPESCWAHGSGPRAPICSWPQLMVSTPDQSWTAEFSPKNLEVGRVLQLRWAESSETWCFSRVPQSCATELCGAAWATSLGNCSVLGPWRLPPWATQAEA